MLVKSTLDYEQTFDLLAAKRHVMGVHSMKYPLGAIALVFRTEVDKQNQFVVPDGLELHCLPCSGKRTKAIDIQTAWESMQGGTCKTNIKQKVVNKSVGESVGDIPTWEEMQDWLSNDLFSTFDARTATARRAIQMKTADRFELCLIKTMYTECKNFVMMLNDCSSIIRKMTEVGHRVYPSGFLPPVKDLRGVSGGAKQVQICQICQIS